MNLRLFWENVATGLLVLFSHSILAQSPTIPASGTGWGSRGNGGGGGGGVSLVQSVSKFTTTSPSSVTINGVQSGHMILVCATIAASSAAALASGNCSDGVASYTLDNGSALTLSLFRSGCWSRVAAATGNLTITLTPAQASAMDICVYEVAGLANNAFDVCSKGNGVASDTGTSTTPTTSTFTTATAGIIVVTECESTGGAGITHTAGANYAISDSGNAHFDDNSGANASGCLEHRVTTGALVNTTATVTIPSQTWLIRAFAYK